MARTIIVNLVLLMLLAKVVTAELGEVPNPDLMQDNAVLTSLTGLTDLNSDTYWRQNVVHHKLFKNLQHQDSTNDRSTPKDETWPEIYVKATSRQEMVQPVQWFILDSAQAEDKDI